MVGDCVVRNRNGKVTVEVRNAAKGGGVSAHVAGSALYVKRGTYEEARDYLAQVSEHYLNKKKVDETDFTTFSRSIEAQGS
jgi:hypothetical protein